jgi:hypothetical protein
VTPAGGRFETRARVSVYEKKRGKTLKFPKHFPMELKNGGSEKYPHLLIRA